MTNFFAGMLPIHLRYDLKGSTVGREASEREKAKGDKAIMKDLDWLSQGRHIEVQGEEATSNFKESLRLDSEWLAKHELIDYSLLVGVHDRERFRESNGSEARERKEYMHVCTLDTGDCVLYIGIVDILQPYTLQKG